MRQEHASEYPTLALVAIDVLPIQASSVPCERLFSGAKGTATEKRARTGAEHFEELQVMKFEWKPDVYDYAKWNSAQVELVEEELMHEFVDMFMDDKEMAALDIVCGTNLEAPEYM